MRGLHSDLVEGGEGGREDSVLQQAEVSEGEGGELPEQAGAGLAPVSVEQVLPGFSPLHSHWSDLSGHCALIGGEDDQRTQSPY